MLNAPWIPACDVSVSPDEPQPGPMSTGGRVPPSADGSGNQWIRIVVPSNDVRSKSEGMPGTATALVDCHPPGGWQPSAAAAAEPDSQRAGPLSEEPAAPPATTRASVSTAMIHAAQCGRDLLAMRYRGAPNPSVPLTVWPLFLSRCGPLAVARPRVGSNEPDLARDEAPPWGQRGSPLHIPGAG